VARSKGASEVEVGAAVQKALASSKRSTPTGADQAFDFVTPVQEEYDGSMHLLYEGAMLAVLVVWLFLRDWRATFVSAVALPLSVIPAFVGMYLLGFSINVVTLLALSLVIGILVDDAIVEVENIVRHLRMGKTPYQAAMEAADEIGLAVIATTFTLIAVFLPTAFMSGVAGKFFKQFGWTASLAVFASLVVARVLTPMMAAYILKPIVGTGTRSRLDADLPALGTLVHEAPLDHHGRWPLRSSSARSR
jgi:multidrug efflux pump subunit AcrB